MVRSITTTNEVLAYYRRHQSGKEHEDEVLGFNWYRIILDEAHSMKNLKSLSKLLSGPFNYSSTN